MSEHQVEAIIGRKVFSGKVLYLTKWKNFTVDQATWESVKVLKDYRHLIRAYNEKNRTESSPFSFQDNEDGEEEKLKAEKKEAATCDDDHGTKNDQMPPIAEIAHSAQKKDGQFKVIQGSQEIKLKAVVPHMKKKRGRPAKTQMAVKMGFARQNQSSYKRDSLPIDFLKKVSRIYQQDYERKGCVKLQESSLKDRGKKPQSQLIYEGNQQSVEKANISETENSLTKIYLVEKAQSGESQYIVEMRGGKFRKYGTREMIKLYPQQLVNFLEQSLFKRSAQSFNIF